MKNRVLGMAIVSAVFLTAFGGVAVASPAHALASPQTATPAGNQMKTTGQMKHGMPDMAKLMANKPWIKQWQRVLVRHGATIAVDGVCGKETIDALRAFQKAHGLKVTGMPDPETVKALGVRYPLD